MKLFKFISIIIMILIIITSVTACTDNVAECNPPQSPSQVINNYFYECQCGCHENDNSINSTEKEPSYSNGPSADETNPAGTVLYHDEFVKITLQKLGEGLLGPTINILIENNSEANLLIMCDESSVDGFSIQASLYTEVGPGKKAVDKITIWESDLEECGITKPKAIEFKFQFNKLDQGYGSWESEFIYVNLNK